MGDIGKRWGRAVRRAARLLVLVAGLLLVGSAANAAETVILQLPGVPQFRYAGYYAALWQGFYRDAGLTVEIRPGAAPGKPAIDPMREVVDGRAAFGVGGTRVLIHAAEGLPLVMLAPVFQHSGVQIYSRAGRDFVTPATLAGGKVGRLPASATADLELATALRGAGVDGAKLQPVEIAPGQVAAALVAGTVDAAPGSAWDVPFQAREHGVTLDSFDPGDYRVPFYGDGLFTTQQRAATDPDTVRRFRAASLRGWDYAFQHADAVAGEILAKLPIEVPVSDPVGFARYQAGVARTLAELPATTLGHDDRARWEKIQQSLLGVAAMPHGTDLAAFVYVPAGSDDNSRWLAPALAIAAVVFALAVALAALSVTRRRRRRRPALPALPPSPPTELDLNALVTAHEGTMRAKLPRAATLHLSLLDALWHCDTGGQDAAPAILALVESAAGDLDAGGTLVVGTRNYPIDAETAAAHAATAGDYARITVKDSGPGLTEAALADITEPSRTSRPAIAAAAQFVHRLGGFIRVESAEAVGTAVHLYFPRAGLEETAKAAQ